MPQSFDDTVPHPGDDTVPHPGDWNLVIKVKYGDTLKRLNGCVNGSHLDYNLVALRSMIVNAYKFSPEDDFILTYTDEDGDVIMLDDDDDLHDAAISQKLNPIRIDVKLKRTPQTEQQSSGSMSPTTPTSKSVGEIFKGLKTFESNRTLLANLEGRVGAAAGSQEWKKYLQLNRRDSQKRGPPVFESNEKSNGNLQTGHTFSSGENNNEDGENNNGDLQTALPPPLANSVSNFIFNFIMPSVVRSYAPYQEACSFEDSYLHLSNKYGSVPKHTLHLSIQCEGCRVTPNVEPHHKSHVKYNCDLTKSIAKGEEVNYCAALP